MFLIEMTYKNYIREIFVIQEYGIVTQLSQVIFNNIFTNSHSLSTHSYYHSRSKTQCLNLNPKIKFPFCHIIDSYVQLLSIFRRYRLYYLYCQTFTIKLLVHQSYHYTVPLSSHIDIQIWTPALTVNDILKSTLITISCAVVLELIVVCRGNERKSYQIHS